MNTTKQHNNYSKIPTQLRRHQELRLQPRTTAELRARGIPLSRASCSHMSEWFRQCASNLNLPVKQLMSNEVSYYPGLQRRAMEVVHTRKWTALFDELTRQRRQTVTSPGKHWSPGTSVATHAPVVASKRSTTVSPDTPCAAS